MKGLNTKSVTFDKSEMKDLVIYQMVKFMQQNWSDDEVIDLFHNPQFCFYEQDKKYGITAELMQEQKEAVNHLITFQKTYYQIEKWKNGDYNLAELFTYDLSKEDVRFIDEVERLIEKTISFISDFLTENLLKKTGILISENILATRLGINKNASSDWLKVLKKLEEHKYKGVFSEGWKRWWMSGLENWWSSELQIEKSLRSTKASDKVNILKEKLELNGLVPLEKVEKSKSETFWTNCVGSGVAIDTVDGLLIAGQDNYFPWQDKNYISYKEALNPKRKDIWKKLSPSEKHKIELLKT